MEILKNLAQKGMGVHPPSRSAPFCSLFTINKVSNWYIPIKMFNYIILSFSLFLCQFSQHYTFHNFQFYDLTAGWAWCTHISVRVNTKCGPRIRYTCTGYTNTRIKLNAQNRMIVKLYLGYLDISWWNFFSKRRSYCGQALLPKKIGLFHQNLNALLLGGRE